MADINKLKDKIKSTIYPNGKGAINAADHQAMLLDMADGMAETDTKLAELSKELESKVDKSEVPIPDWDAAEDEAGYIKNRTHYKEAVERAFVGIEKGDYILDAEGNPDGWESWVEAGGIEDENAKVSLPVTIAFGLGHLNFELTFDHVGQQEILEYEEYDSSYASILEVGIDEKEGECYLHFTTRGCGTPWLYDGEEIDVRIESFKRLDDEYIPSTIVRKSDLEGLSAEIDSQNQLIEDLQNTKIDKEADDYYPQLSVGLADNLAGRGESVPAEFGFRASGGKSIKDGRAYIKRIKGNSVVWNQLNTEDNAEGIIDNSNNSAYKYETLYTLPCYSSEIAGHIILAIATDKGSGVDRVYFTDNVQSNLIGGAIFTANTSANVGVIARVPAYTIANYNISLVFRDLTLMFGAGNEPTTIEEYEARKPIVEDEYAYNEGEVIHCNTESIKSVGDNALNADRSLVFDFDGSYGNYDFINTEDAFVGISADGYIRQEAIDYAEKIEGGFRFRSNGGGYGIGLFVKALPNEEYSVSYASDNGRITFGFYDKDKKFISYQLWENRFTTPSNCEYIMLCLRDNEVMNVDISFTDIMLSLVHSGWPLDTDAGYRPYWEDTLPLPIIRKYFRQGMKSAGNAHDEIRYNKASGKWEYSKGKIKSVDLWTLEWSTLMNNGRLYFKSTMNQLGAIEPEKLDQTKAYGICSAYEVISYLKGIDIYNGVGDKVLLLNHGYFGNVALEKDLLVIYDSSYTDVESFKAMLQEKQVKLYYESNNWEWVELDAEDQNFRDYYNVADFGTEMSQSKSNVPSAAFSADIIYQFNAVDMIREHEAEITELQKVIATMQAQLTSLING